MRLFSTEFVSFFLQHQSGRNVKAILKLFFILGALVAVYASIFVFLMEREGQNHDWITGVYWTVISMSTAGYGDVVFHGAVGKLFSVIVVSSGLLFLFIFLPAFIQFLYAPLMEAQTSARVPRQLPADTHGHVVLTHWDEVTQNLVRKLENYKYPYVLIEPNFERALQLHDQGVKVLFGSLDNPEVCKNARVRKAALVVSTASDAVNTNITFTVREVAERVPIVTTVDNADAEEILKLAGSTYVLKIHEMMGQFLTRRAMEGDYAAHVVAQFDHVVIAEISAKGATFAGKTISASKLREEFGMTIVGFWDHSWFESATPEKIISPNAILIVACSREQLDLYNKKFYTHKPHKKPVIIVGGGRVGSVAARTMEEHDVPYQMIERSFDQAKHYKKCIVGDAASREVLKKAGIQDASSIIISTRDDDVNIYLTIYCRQLRPDLMIISRSTLPRNVATLQRAGADFVLSYASLGSNAIFNILKRGNVFLLAEGLNIFKTPLPDSLKGKTLVESAIRPKTGCHVLALNIDGAPQFNPDPNQPLPENTEIILAGSVDAETNFFKTFGK
ncbi:MAG: potassium channel family protein [Verrucomicrobiota bacterium]